MKCVFITTSFLLLCARSLRVAPSNNDRYLFNWWTVHKDIDHSCEFECIRLDLIATNRVTHNHVMPPCILAASSDQDKFNCHDSLRTPALRMREIVRLTQFTWTFVWIAFLHQQTFDLNFQFSHSQRDLITVNQSNSISCSLWECLVHAPCARCLAIALALSLTSLH